jgi:hypothetical protein
MSKPYRERFCPLIQGADRRCQAGDCAWFDDDVSMCRVMVLEVSVTGRGRQAMIAPDYELDPVAVRACIRQLLESGEFDAQLKHEVPSNRPGPVAEALARLEKEDELHRAVRDRNSLGRYGGKP